jgi:hypothetical protein
VATVTLCFYAQFTASKAGANSLTVTWDVERITRADGTRSALQTGAATNITVGRRGLYGYYQTGCDLDLYDYVATAITSDTTVDQKEIPSLWTYWIAEIGDAAVGSVTGNVGGNVTGNVGSLAAQAQTDVQTALTNQGYTTTRAGYLDTLNGLVAAIWDKATSAITTAGSIGKVIKDNLDATISSRLASASYTAPDNATISTLSTNVSTLLGRLGAFTGSGVNTVLGMLKALGSKSATTPTDMGGTYDASTDSQEAAIDNAVGGATPAQLWSYASRTLTQSASQVNAAVSGSDITILRGDRVTVNLTGIGSLVGRTKLWITVKWSTSQSDGEAVIQAEETAGLLTLNGASYATATDSVITVTDASSGALTWVLKEAATRQLSAPVAGMVYDIQILTSGGPVTRVAGSVNTTADVTRAVT